ncbi:amidohydrolase family protein [Sutterella sp.]|uniref:amidohydrolase family protein n=1 Tax=Sutterella sp. TaxID=1981025 RepID=UPI0026E03100|nr:amidohydrolase family protein [Sutterella sp.]MDO5532383.1 amidohydrolase family protein [Sutterella sp.]
MYDLILRNAQVVDPLNGVNTVADVAIEDGKIAKVEKEIAGPAKAERDYTGLVLQPGIIDSHVHLGSMWGSYYGHRMLALKGVTTCLDMAGPMEDILDNVDEYGAGLNVAILQFASPPFTFKNSTPSKDEMIALIDKSLEDGALGVKLLGGHYPLDPEVSSTLVETALERRAYVAWHAGTTKHGSNIEGMQEAVEMARGRPLHLAHINAYCRGAIHNEIDECRIAIDLLEKNPNIMCESYISPKNGTRLTCSPDGTIQSKVTGNCLRRFGFSEDREGVRACILAKKAFVVYDAGGYSDLCTGEEALKLWEAANSDVGGSFNVNPPIPRINLAQAKRKTGEFVVDAISTDGGCIPRNVILELGLSLVKLDVLTLPEFVQKTSLNPARMLRLYNKGHLSVGADADITVYDFARQVPVAAYVAGSPILENGEVVGKKANIVCTGKGADAIAKRGLKSIVVDPGEQIQRLKAL